MLRARRAKVNETPARAGLDGDRAGLIKLRQKSEETMVPAANVFWMLDRSARSAYGGRTALQFGDRSHTFKSLRDRAVAFAAGLKAQGIARGDRVAVLMGNRLEWPEIFFGLAAAGAVCVPVNVLLTTREIEHVLSDSGASCMIVDELGLSAVQALDVAPGLFVTVGEAAAPSGAQTIAYEAMLDGQDTTIDPADQPGLDDAFIFYYSSGTTGLPKAAMHTHNGVLWNTMAQVIDLRLTPDVVYLVVPSFSWAAGFHNTTLALLWIGGRSIIMPTGGTTAAKILEAVETHDVTHVMLVPTLIRQFAADDAVLERLSGTKLRWIVTGAEPVPTHLVAKMSEALPGCGVCQGYGLSEFPTIATVLQPDEAMVRNGSAGRPLSHVNLAVQCDDGQIRKSGRGELLIRSPATMKGYHNAPEKTADAFTDGWLHTGDLADIDEDGYVFIIGRTKDMIISGGLNVYPKEIEEVLHGQPGVAEIAVVGVPDDRFGEKAVAVIVRDGDAEVDIGGLDRVCREHLAGYKLPRDYLLRSDPLPRNPTGKILKRELRPWAQAMLESLKQTA
jgi:fatty-acyl-CoA synthase